jgi:hypothetical protein
MTIIPSGASLTYANPDALLDCPARAAERVEVYDHQALTELQGIEYACGVHMPAVLAAVRATGAYARATHVGEFEPAHTCGNVVSYVGPVKRDRFMSGPKLVYSQPGGNAAGQYVGRERSEHEATPAVSVTDDRGPRSTI